MYTGNVVNSEIKIHATVVSRNVFFQETWHRLVFIFFLFVASQIFIFAV